MKQKVRDMYNRARDLLFVRQQAYQQTFTGVYAGKVLHDLSNFCRANKTTFHDDTRVSAVLQGRREVWLRIEQYLKLRPDDLWEIYNNKEN